MQKIINVYFVGRPESTKVLIEALRRCDNIQSYVILFHAHRLTDEYLAILKTANFTTTRSIPQSGTLNTFQSRFKSWKESFSCSDFIIDIPPNFIPLRDCLAYMDHCRQAFEKDLTVFWAHADNTTIKKGSDMEVARRPIEKLGIVGVWKDRWEWARNQKQFNPCLPFFGIRQKIISQGFVEVFPLLSRCITNFSFSQMKITPPKDEVKLEIKLSLHEKPLVTAVMVTGMHSSRYVLAKVAIDCFKRQTYRNRELLIVNHGPESLYDGDHRIREMRVHRSGLQTVGDLRNIGLQHAQGKYIICWDDDDWHHPSRIQIQMEHQTSDAAVLLESRIHYSFSNGSAAYCRIKEGGLSTILFPTNVDFKYPSLVRGSDVIFARHFTKRVVVNNDPKLYIRFYHGLNLWDEHHIMGYLAGEKNKNTLQIKAQHRKLLGQVLDKYRDWTKYSKEQ